MLPTGLTAAGLGETQREVLLALKRRGPSTLVELQARLSIARATLRGHLRSLAGRRLVTRRPRRGGGPGRPEMVYRLTDAAEALFPRREGAVLRQLAEYLAARGEAGTLAAFIEHRAATRIESAIGRLAGLSGAARLAAVAGILSDEGYMAEIAPDGPDGAPVLRLCHCPIRDLVAVTDAPCRAEVRFAEALLGERLARTEYAAAGDASCAYAVRGAS